MAKSIKANYLFNLINSASQLLFPLITFPYASRIMMADGIGQVNFFQSIISYISLFTCLGIPMYAIREVAKVRDNPEKMTKPELWKYIPENGIILEEETCTIETGETVFDVLNRVCKEKDIQIEYSYTTGYDSYYVEGIQYLYEFDAGKRSGWIYRVDEKNTNYGCSQYKLKGGEKIVWEYICDYK